jgi:hypothetical protein
MLDACTPETRIVDGYEASYGYKEWVQFLEGYHQIKNQALEISRAPMQYRLHVDAAFGVWMDCNSHKNPWNTEDFSKNHFSPQAFQKALHYALKASDKYVWVRTERVNWWTGEKIPQEYEEALTKAREDP